MGKSVLPVHDICGIFYDYRSVPEHYHICKRDVGVVLTEISAHNGALLILLGLPCVLGLTDWSGIQILGKNIMDFEDFLVSNNLLPLGSLIYLLFCVTKYGWGWDHFLKEANTGTGIKFPGGRPMKLYLTFVLPAVILFIFVQGYMSMFAGGM